MSLVEHGSERLDGRAAYGRLLAPVLGHNELVRAGILYRLTCWWCTLAYELDHGLVVLSEHAGCIHRTGSATIVSPEFRAAVTAQPVGLRKQARLLLAGRLGC